MAAVPVRVDEDGRDGSPSSVHSWNSVLELLEAAVLAAEKNLSDSLRPLAAGDREAGRPDWIPPQMQGRLPDDMRQRAQALVGAQQRITAQLEAAKRAAARQLAAVESVPAGSPARGAMYLDVRG